ncbi:MAG: DNA internalization-related competence protein ComEC/Rec2 [Clostridiales bacterium]|nr:DNA internalization-related competence protein ComEC/Rec2 [Clostridiales bacterium]
MRRHILFIASAYAIGIWMQYALQLDRIILGIAFVLSFLTAIILKNAGRWTGVLMMLVLGGCILFQFYSYNQNIIYKYDNMEVSLEGFVTHVSEINPNSNRIVVKADKIIFKGNVIKTNNNILVNIEGKADNIYSWIGHDALVSGRIYIPESNRNPGTFNYQLYLKTKNTPMVMDCSVKDINVDLSQYNVIPKLLARIKYGFLEDIRNAIGVEEAGVLTGILFGDKSFIEDSVYENFQRNGTAHILAVSGIHIGILYGFIEFLLRRTKNIIKDILIALLLIFYAAVSEFSPSVIRAVFMILLYILSKRIHRRYDLLSAAAFIAFMILVYNPYMLFNVGFQLSFAAVFAVGTIYPYLKNMIDLKNSLLDMIILLLAVQIGTAPIVAYHFNYFSIAAFIINIPVIAFAGLILPLGFVLLTMNFVHEGLFDVLAYFLEVLLNALIKINQLGALLPHNSIDVMSPSIVALIIFYLTVFFAASEILPPVLEKNKIKILFIGAVLTLLCFVLTPQLKDNGYEVIFVDVGQGDCIHIRTPKGKNILVDGGGSEGDSYNVGKKVLLPYLLKNGVNTIDLAVITHLHADHYKGILSIMDTVKVSKLALYQDTTDKNMLSKIKSICSEKNSSIIYIKKDDRINIEKGVAFYVLYPKAGTVNAEENNNSLVLLLDYHGHRILFTGDIEEDAEKKLIESNVKAEILKIPHHGSSTSSTEAFIAAVNPKAGIIQVGKNTFGHPDKDVIKRYLDADVQIFRADEKGAVLMDIRQDKIIIDTMLNGDKNGL